MMGFMTDANHRVGRGSDRRWLRFNLRDRSLSTNSRPPHTYMPTYAWKPTKPTLASQGRFPNHVYVGFVRMGCTTPCKLCICTPGGVSWYQAPFFYLIILRVVTAVIVFRYFLVPGPNPTRSSYPNLARKSYGVGPGCV